MQSLEQQTGLHLFERSNKGLRLTEAGHRLVDSSRAVMDGVDSFNRSVVGQEDLLEGELRVSANEIIGNLLLPRALAALKRRYPQLQIELDINNSFTSLSKRDADIAFRMAKPTQPDLVGRRLPDLPLGIYGTRELIEEYGQPTSIEHLFTLPFIGFDKERWLIDGLAHMGLKLSVDDFQVRSDGLLTQLNLARAGVGYSVVQKGLAKNYPELVPVLENIPLPDLPFWLVCHADIQYSKKIREVMSFLGDWFRESPYEFVVV